MLKRIFLLVLLAALLAACNSSNQADETAATQTSETMMEEDMAATDEAMMEDENMATEEAMMEEESMATEEAMMEEDMEATGEPMMEEEMATEEPMEEEMMDEPVSFSVTIENISGSFAYYASGAFTIPVGSDEAGPAMPDNAYEFEFNANPGDYLSFATMFVQSNDWFFAPDEAGITLFDADGNPVSGDVTEQVLLWDAGTEIDQAPGEGVDQAPRQAGPDTGEADPDNTVRQVADESVPAVSDLIQVTLEPGENNSFILRIDNISGSSALPSPLAPGVYAVHKEPAPLFTAGEADHGEGLEALAEDGDPMSLAETLTAETGISTPLSPGLFVIHEEPNILFVPGEADAGNGLEGLAEDGDPSLLDEYLAAMEMMLTHGVFTIPDGADSPGPLMPGQSYSFNFEAAPGYHLTLATMFVQSNDLFYGLENFPLFDEEGHAVEGDLTMEFILWDAGTEVNEAPGFGPDQAPRQAEPNTGEAEDRLIQPVEDNYTYPPTAQVIQVTLSVGG